MKLLATTIAAAFVSAALPLYAGSAAVAPLSQLTMLKTDDRTAVEQVQYRRWSGDGDRYGAYAAAPGYDAYAGAPRYDTSGSAMSYRRDFASPLPTSALMASANRNSMCLQLNV